MTYNENNAQQLKGVVKRLVDLKHMRYMAHVLKAKTYTLIEKPLYLKSKITQAEKDHNIHEVITWMDLNGSIQHELIYKHHEQKT